jgi:polyphenol oxidase
MPVETIIGPSSENADPDSQSLTESGFFWREHNGVKVLVCRALEAAGFANGFSTRLGGVSSFSVPPASAGGQLVGDLNLAGFDDDTAENIYENRRRFMALFGGEHQLATAWQVHGDTIKTVRSANDIRNSEERADALISDLENVMIGVKTADCVPVLIGDAKTRAFAAVHAGWRGTVSSIVGKVVKDLIENLGSDPTDLICAIGPAACGRNYEIGKDVIDAFAENFNASEKYFSPIREGHALIDLHLANKDQLIDCGVASENVYTAPFCTMERPDLFFSYRLEKKKYGKTGRLLSVIGRAN